MGGRRGETKWHWRATNVRQVCRLGASRRAGRCCFLGTGCALTSAVDFDLTGTLIVAAAAAPYVVEILRQVPLLTRMMSSLSAEVRAGFPPHPRRPGLALFGSTRFFLALVRYVLRTDPRDPAEIRALKRRMRASVIREALFGVTAAVVVFVLWRHGWRPFGT